MVSYLVPPSGPGTLPQCARKDLDRQGKEESTKRRRGRERAFRKQLTLSVPLPGNKRGQRDGETDRRTGEVMEYINTGSGRRGKGTFPAMRDCKGKRSSTKLDSADE